MKIANTLLTSVACLRKYFDFHAVWGQLDIFVRDMSPKEVPYPDAASKFLYGIIVDPGSVIIENERILVSGSDDSPFVLNNAESLEMAALQRYMPEDRIRILALFELADRKVSEECISLDALKFESCENIVLVNGHSLKIVDKDYSGCNLDLRLIKVDPDSPCSSIVDGIEIEQGKCVYGVFSKYGLHHVLNTVAQNGRYRMKITVSESGAAHVIVHNKQDGTRNNLRNVKSFCTIGEDNYAYIKNGMVYCHHNSELAKRMKDTVGMLDSPLFLQSDADQIAVTMKDGSVKYISFK